MMNSDLAPLLAKISALLLTLSNLVSAHIQPINLAPSIQVTLPKGFSGLTESAARPFDTSYEKSIVMPKFLPLSTPEPVVSLPATQPSSIKNDSPQPESDTAAQFASAYAKSRAAAYRILCTFPAGTAQGLSTGSGVAIDSRGVILTNAHVAQYFLIDGKAPGAHCELQSADSVAASYSAKVLYIPPRWLAAHGGNLLDTRPYGSGQDDFALLQITGRGFPLIPAPDSFAYLAPNIQEKAVSVGNTVLMTGFPSPSANLNSKQRLSIVSAAVPVEAVYGFAGPETDALSLEGSNASYHGSSGGPVADSSGSLVGITFGTLDGTTIEARKARILSLSYINRDFQSLTGQSLREYLAFNLESKASLFSEQNAGLLQNFFTLSGILPQASPEKTAR